MQIKINKNNPKIIVFRTDRIGDTILSIQVAELLKQKFPNGFVSFVVRKYTKSLFENNPFVDEVLAIDEYSEKEFVDIVKSKKFDISICLYSTKLSAKIPFLAKIPVRIGPMSKIYGFFYFNVRVWQKRSRSIKNEAEYNNDLLKVLDIENIAYPKIYLTEKEIEFGRKYFEDLGLKKQKLIILHPGSGGSSKDWSIKNYFELARELKKNKNFQIFITGSKSEIEKYQKFKDEFLIMKEELQIREFLAVLNQADIFISNSTGPLHCASALGKKTISFYAPIKTCKWLRWGPFAQDKNQNFIFTPKVKECKKCKTTCPDYFCMDKIKVQEVLERVNLLLINN